MRNDILAALLSIAGVIICLLAFPIMAIIMLRYSEWLMIQFAR